MQRIGDSRTRCLQRTANPCRRASGNACVRYLLQTSFGLIILIAPGVAFAQAGAPGPEKVAPPRVIVVGFVGGFARNDDERHPEVQIIERLSMEEISGVRVGIFENRRRGKARKTILRWLGLNQKSARYDSERRNTTIILFGHSWGGAAVIKLARELGRKGIPVNLTIQVDSINKGSGDDCLVPANVREAMNFYQTRSFLHGCSAIRPEDPSSTRILADGHFEYTELPLACRDYPWIARKFFSPHIAIECDPQLWSGIETEIRSRIDHAVDTGGQRLTADAHHHGSDK